MVASVVYVAATFLNLDEVSMTDPTIDEITQYATEIMGWNLLVLNSIPFNERVDILHRAEQDLIENDDNH